MDEARIISLGLINSVLGAIGVLAPTSASASSAAIFPIAALS
jgi:hypothetical protein